MLFNFYPIYAWKPMPALECKWIESSGDKELDLDKLFCVYYTMLKL